MGKNVEALKDFDHSLMLNPQNTFALYNKGYSLASVGDWENAIKYFDKELAVDKQLGLKPDSDALANRDIAEIAVAANIIGLK